MADLTLLLEILTYKNGGQNKKVECDSRSLAWLVDYSKLGQKRVDVENACKWLEEHRADEDHTMFYLDSQKDELTDAFIEQFRKAMEK